MKLNIHQDLVGMIVPLGKKRDGKEVALEEDNNSCLQLPLLSYLNTVLALVK